MASEEWGALSWDERVAALQSVGVLPFAGLRWDDLDGKTRTAVKAGLMERRQTRILNERRSRLEIEGTAVDRPAHKNERGA